VKRNGSTYIYVRGKAQDIVGEDRVIESEATGSSGGSSLALATTRYVSFRVSGKHRRLPGSGNCDHYQTRTTGRPSRHSYRENIPSTRQLYGECVERAWVGCSIAHGMQVYTCRQSS
jgi:hypothetical protein